MVKQDHLFPSGSCKDRSVSVLTSKIKELGISNIVEDELDAYIGFNELFSAGIIRKIPKLVGIQAENCSPLFHAFYNNLTMLSPFPGKPTIAEGIAIAQPVRGMEIIEAVQKTNGKNETIVLLFTGHGLKTL